MSFDTSGEGNIRGSNPQPKVLLLPSYKNMIYDSPGKVYRLPNYFDPS